MKKVICVLIVLLLVTSVISFTPNETNAAIVSKLELKLNEMNKPDSVSYLYLISGGKVIKESKVIGPVVESFSGNKIQWIDEYGEANTWNGEYYHSSNIAIVTQRPLLE